MNIKVFLAGMSIAIAMTLSCGLKMREAKADSEAQLQEVPPLCIHVQPARDAVKEYADFIFKEILKLQGRDDPEAQVRRGILFALNEQLIYIESGIEGFYRENCAGA